METNEKRQQPTKTAPATAKIQALKIGDTIGLASCEEHYRWLFDYHENCRIIKCRFTGIFRDNYYIYKIEEIVVK